MFRQKYFNQKTDMHRYFLKIFVLLLLLSVFRSPVAAKPNSTIDAIISESEIFLTDQAKNFKTPVTLQQLVELYSEPDKLFEWVQTKTYPLNYEGTLRSPSGVLEDLHGNTLDRTRLLLALFKQNGIEARLVRESLPLAVSLPSGAGYVRESKPAFAEPTALLEKLPVNFADKFAYELAALKERMRVASKATSKAKDLADTIYRKFSGLLKPYWKEGGNYKLQDHYWIQAKVQMPNTDKPTWRSYDITQNKPNETRSRAFKVVTEKTLFQESAFTLYLTIIAEIEDVSLKRRNQKSLVSFTHRLSDESFHTFDIFFAETPRYKESELSLLLADSLSVQPQPEYRRWIPTIRTGDKLTYAQAVNVMGEVSDVPDGLVEALFSGGAQTGQAVNRGVTEATSIFSKMGVATGKKEESKSGTLTGLTLKAELKRGNKTLRTFYRPLVQTNSALPLFTGFLNTFRMSVSTVSPREQTLALRGLEMAKAMIVAAKELVDSGSPKSRTALKTILQYEPASEAYHALRKDLGSGMSDLFPTEPQIEMVRHEVGKKNGEVAHLTTTIDILTNALAPTQLTANAKEARLKQGIIDTVAEARALADISPAGEVVRNAAHVFATSASSWNVYTSLKPSFQYSKEAQAAIRDAHRSGYVTVLSEQENEFWWRIDPTTGETLGLGPTGMGESSIEYTTILSNVLCWSGLATNAIKGFRGLGAGQALIDSALTGTFCIFGGALSIPPMTAKAGAIVSAIGGVIDLMINLRDAFADPPSP
jgi:hypothetical protein